MNQNMMGFHSSNTMLIAVTVLKSLNVVCEYAVQLIKRTGKISVLNILLVHEDKLDAAVQATENSELQNIQRLGKEAEIEINYKVVRGNFSKKVAEYLYDLDCPLLVVGEGGNRKKRLKELKEIETILLSNKTWHHRNSHHFLMVSERHKDSTLVFCSEKLRKKDE